MRGLSIWVLLAVLAGCGSGTTSNEAADAAADAPVDRDAWWATATKRASGKARILAPREWRRLLDDGRRQGFDRDAAWWSTRTKEAYGDILRFDSEDVEANEGVGRRTLQSIPGFQTTWTEMQESRVEHPAIVQLLDRFGGWVEEGDPIFLTDDEYEVTQARVTAVRQHLDKLASNPEYEAVQIGVQRVRAMFQSDYPFVHRKFGPFLVFFTARDLQRIEGEDEAAENARIEARREVYQRKLATWESTYRELLADVAKLYPEQSKRRPIGRRTLFVHWVFADAEPYLEFARARGKLETQSPNRTGYFDKRSGWAFSTADVPDELILGTERGDDGEEEGENGARKPSDKELRDAADSLFLESQAFLAATQILRHWAHDPKNPLDNRMDFSRAFWMKEGLPTYLASRRVKRSIFGRELPAALPTLRSLVERRSRVEDLSRLVDLEGDRVPVRERGYTELVFRLVRHFHGDDRREAFLRFLGGVVSGEHRGMSWFETAFELREETAWRGLERAVYGR